MSDCVQWWSYVDKNGYGRVSPTRRTNRLAHRFVWEACFGPIPNGLHVHHTCGSRSCVNPEHLVLITRSAHSRLHRPDSIEPVWRARRARTHCAKGHPYDETVSNRYADGRRRCLVCKAEHAKEMRCAKQS